MSSKKWLLFVALIVCVGCGRKEEAPVQMKAGGQAATSSQYLLAGMQYLKSADPQKAIISFDQAIKADPKNSSNYLVLGSVYLRLKNDAQAEDTFLAALKVDQSNPEIYYLLGVSRFGQTGKKDLAIEAMKKSVELFMQKKDEAGFKRAVMALKGMEEGQIPSMSPSAVAP